MKPISILCLHNVRTGGPEAIHQLSDALISQGFDARMVYYGWDQIAMLERIEPQEAYCFGARENTITEYTRYAVNAVESVANNSDQVIVLPETLCHLAPKFNRATVLIWWLSVDNAFGALSKVNLNHLRRPGVYHVMQSGYAEQVVTALKLPPSGTLTDYTTDMRVYAAPLPFEERPKLVLFNANSHKVTADLQAIADDLGHIDPSIECIPIRNMARKDVAQLFAKARVYVDLGSMPGRDRMPREASSMGCNVVTRSDQGAGDEELWASARTDADVTDCIIKGLASRKIDGAAQLVENERIQFLREAKDIFGDLTHAS